MKEKKEKIMKYENNVGRVQYSNFDLELEINS